MPKKKKARRLRPYQKVQNFLDLYKKTCEIYDVPQLDEVKETYDPVVEKRSRKVPASLQWADYDVDPTYIRPLIESLQNSDVKIRFISFLSTESGDDGLHACAHFFEQPLEVAGFQYNANNVTASGARALGRAIINAKFLSVLELDFNPEMGDEGVAGLLHYGHCPTLYRLSLRFCDIGDRGAAAIGQWLALPNSSVKELLLNGNQIGPQGAIALAEGLAQNKSLTRLDISDNIFGYDAVALMALHDAIRDCPTLHAVNLYNHFECPEGIGEKYLELTQTKPLGECLLTIKMDQPTFQNIRAFALINKKKMAREAKRARIAARKAKKTGLPSPEIIPTATSAREEIPTPAEPPPEATADAGDRTTTGTNPITPDEGRPHNPENPTRPVPQ